MYIKKVWFSLVRRKKTLLAFLSVFVRLLCLGLCFSVFVWMLLPVLVSLSKLWTRACACVQCLYELLSLRLHFFVFLRTLCVSQWLYRLLYFPPFLPHSGWGGGEGDGRANRHLILQARQHITNCLLNLSFICLSVSSLVNLFPERKLVEK